MAQPTPPRFAADAGGGYFVDPSTGEVFDSNSGQIFANPDDLENYAASSAETVKANQASGGSMGAMGGGGALLAAYLASQYGGESAAAAAPAAAEVASAAAPVAASAAPAAATAAPAMPTLVGGLPPAAGAPAMPSMVSGTTAATTPGMLSPGVMSVAGPLALAAIAGYTGKESYDAFKNGEGRGAMGGFRQGIKDAGWLNAIPLLGQAPAFAGAIGGAFGSGKDRAQMNRDKFGRRAGQASGNVDNDYNVTLSDGQKVNIGGDGSIKSYNIDFSKQGADRAASYGDVLAYLQNGKTTDKIRSDVSGLYGNAAMQGADLAGTFRNWTGNNHAAAYQAIAQSDLDPGTRDAYLNALDEMYQTGAYAGGPKPAAKPAVAAVPKPAAVPAPKDPMRPGGLRPVVASPGKPVMLPSKDPLKPGQVMLPRIKPTAEQPAKKPILLKMIQQNANRTMIPRRAA